MADLDPLIRYRKYGVDEKRRFLARLYEEAEKLEAARQDAEENVAKERRLAEELGSAEALSALGAYMEAMRLKIKKIDESISKMEKRIAAAQEDMRNAFAEMKKVEITQRGRKEREQSEEQQKEDNELDEIAIGNYRRRTDEGEE